MGNNPGYTTELIKNISKKYPNISNIMQDEHNITYEFSNSLWKLYTEIRNIYSHTHGIISNENKTKIDKLSSKFRKEFDKVFHTDFLLSSLMIESNNLFISQRINIDKFYLITDEELNIFRNFISEYISSLSKLANP